MTTAPIPASDPKANYLKHKDEIDAAIQRVLASGQYILGSEVAAFEQEFAGYIGSRSAIGVANGTEALYLALRACDIGPGDIVITVSHTAVATVAAIEMTGAMPMLIDIVPTTFTMDPQHLRSAIEGHLARPRASGGRLRAVIPVHLYGHPAHMPDIMKIANQYDLYVIEDCAQSHGAVVSGRKTGTWGHLAAFSFYPTKNLGALGDGGAVVTDDTKLSERVRLLREYGWKSRYISAIAGINSRLDELQAAILRIKLKYLDEENARRQKIADLYNGLLRTVPILLPQVAADRTHVYHQYVIRTKSRDDLKTYLKARAIATLIHYPMPVHLQPAYRDRVLLGHPQLPYTEEVCAEILSLPIDAQMGDRQVQEVCETIGHWHLEAAGAK